MCSADVSALVARRAEEAAAEGAEAAGRTYAWAGKHQQAGAAISAAVHAPISRARRLVRWDKGISLVKL